ncbi:hypothetical protein ACFQ1S_17270, partial [Kibdelosporangium lantanae]
AHRTASRTQHLRTPPTFPPSAVVGRAANTSQLLVRAIICPPGRGRNQQYHQIGGFFHHFTNQIGRSAYGF